MIISGVETFTNLHMVRFKIAVFGDFMFTLIDGCGLIYPVLVQNSRKSLLVIAIL